MNWQGTDYYILKTKRILLIETLILALGIFCLLKFAFAEIPIYCPKCKTHLYNYQKEIIKDKQVKAKDFLPANDLIPQPLENTEMICPFDGVDLNGWLYWGKAQGFKSFNLVYNAISLLTKDKDGKWLWIPYDMPELNFNEEK